MKITRFKVLAVKRVYSKQVCWQVSVLIKYTGKNRKQIAIIQSPLGTRDFTVIDTFDCFGLKDSHYEYSVDEREMFRIAEKAVDKFNKKYPPQ
jgi:hypothetical protein